MTINRPISEWRRDGPIAVIGSAGQQGSAVIDALLKKRVPVRAVIRNPYGDKAHALDERGVEVVYADLEDVGSVGWRLMVRPPLSR